MMKTGEVFELTTQIDDKIFQAEEAIRNLKSKYRRIHKMCPHELVFKYKDNYPKRMDYDGNYYCPACGKTIKCREEEQLFSTDFCDSRVIDLTNLSLFGSSRVLFNIKKTVRDNMDLFYDTDIKDEVLSCLMTEVLIDYESDYYDHSKVYAKRRD